MAALLSSNMAFSHSFTARPRSHRIGRETYGRTSVTLDPCHQHPMSARASATGNSSIPSTINKDCLSNYFSTNAEVSVYVVIATQLVSDAQARHSMAPTATAALGRLLMGTLLINALKGPQETIQVTFSGRGDLGQMTSVAQEGKWVKGFVSNPRSDPPLKANGKMDVAAAVGPGILTVVRSHPAWQAPYTGTVPLQTGEVAEDLAHYLAESEQVNSALSLGVLIGRDARVKAAGGFLVQVLPGCTEEALSQVESNVSGIAAVSELVSGGLTAKDIADRLLDGLGSLQGFPAVSPAFGPCSLDELKPRMLRAVEYLGKEDLINLLDEQGGKVEVKCEFCSESVTFEANDLHHILEEAH